MVFSLVLGFNHTFWVVASFKPHTLNSQALMIKKKQQKTYLLLKGVPTRFDDIMKGTLFVSSERSMNTLCTLVSGNTYKTSYLLMFSSLTTSASQLCILRTPKIAEITVRVTGRQFTCFLHASRADSRFARSTSPVTVFPRGHTAMTCY